MAHEIEQLSDGSHAMFSVSETPWHGLGKKLDAPPSVQDAIKLAGLDWTVASKPLYADVDGLQIETDARAIIRSTDNSVLGVVGEGYTPVQNLTCFDFFQPAVEAGFVTLETAGSLRGGRRVWVQAKIKDATHDVVSGDPVSAFFLLSNSHDGTLAVRCGPTAQRVVCQNTLTMAHNSSKLIQVRHTKNVAVGLEKLGEIVDWHRNQFKATVEQMKELAACGCDEKTLRSYIEQVFEPEVKTRSTSLEGAKESYDKLMEKILPLFENGRGNTLPGVRGTMWAAYNATTEHLTWNAGRSNDTRLESLWFGLNGKTNQRAFEVAQKMAA